MPLADEMKNIVDHIVSSYEARIQSVASLFDTTHQILRGFQESLLDMKQERETLNAELRESLAQNESLRRKDFNHMMQGILTAQEGREREVRTLLNRYLDEQKQMAQDLSYKGEIPHKCLIFAQDHPRGNLYSGPDNTEHASSPSAGRSY